MRENAKNIAKIEQKWSNNYLYKKLSKKVAQVLTNHANFRKK